MSKKNATNQNPEERNPKFAQIFKNMTNRCNLMEQKNAVYGDSVGKTFAEHGLISVVVRLEDKLNRIKSFASGKVDLNEASNSESLIDTLQDLANYCDLAVYELSQIAPANPTENKPAKKKKENKAEGKPAEKKAEESPLAKELSEYSKEELLMILSALGGEAPNNVKKTSKSKVIAKILKTNNNEAEVEAAIEKAFKPVAKKSTKEKETKTPNAPAAEKKAESNTTPKE